MAITLHDSHKPIQVPGKEYHSSHAAPHKAERGTGFENHGKDEGCASNPDQEVEVREWISEDEQNATEHTTRQPDDRAGDEWRAENQRHQSMDKEWLRLVASITGAVLLLRAAISS
jgi:hypothetical protein